MEGVRSEPKPTAATVPAFVASAPPFGSGPPSHIPPHAEKGGAKEHEAKGQTPREQPLSPLQETMFWGVPPGTTGMQKSHVVISGVLYKQEIVEEQETRPWTCTQAHAHRYVQG